MNLRKVNSNIINITNWQKTVISLERRVASLEFNLNRIASCVDDIVVTSTIHDSKLDEIETQEEIPDNWKQPIARYLSRNDVSVITIKELLLYPLKELEGNAQSTSHQMRVANILKSLRWLKLGRREYAGKRQIVWGKSPSR